MRTVFVGAGSGCKAVLELVVQHRLPILSLEIVGVVDLNADAPGMRYARSQGWPTFIELEEALRQPGLELVIELTGIDSLRDTIYHIVPEGVRVMDHYMARVFWDLDEVVQNLRDELDLNTKLVSEMREDRRRLQEILDSLPDAVIVVDQDGRIERVNRRFETVTGVRMQEVLKGLCFDKICKKRCTLEDGKTLCPHESVVATGKPVSVVDLQSCIGWDNRDEESYYEITANPVREAEGRTSVVLTSREVTEQILLKRETQEAARSFDQILATVDGLITIKDLEGRYQVVNTSAARFFGLEAKEFLGKTADELLPPEVAEIIVQNDEVLMREPEHLSQEEVIRLRGEDHTLISERFLLTDYRGQPVGICCVSNNVTVSRRLHRELLRSVKHAAMGKLAAGVAHEINNPLTGILTYAEDLADHTSEQDPVREDLRFIIHETLRCRRIVRDLLDYSRHTKPNRQLTAIWSIIRKTVKLVQRQASFHDIRFHLDHDRGDHLVVGDANQLQQVMLNLIINARDAMDGKGTVTVRAGEITPDNLLVVEVIDQGCGIPEDSLGRIFEPFFSTKGEHGNGMGLPAVCSIIEEHGGRIDVESDVGRGSVFRVFIPVVHNDDEARSSQVADRPPEPSDSIVRGRSEQNRTEHGGAG